MALVHPFRALRPVPEAALAVAAVPYDVVSTEEARALAAGNPLSFLHVSRAEIDLVAETDPYSDEVYRKATDNLAWLKQRAPLVEEHLPSLYFYRLRDGDHEQTGLAGCYSLDHYDHGLIKKHERTHRDKEDDRTRHIVALGAQTGIVFLAYRASPDLAEVRERVCRGEPLFDFEAADGVGHTVWRLDRTDQAAAVAAFDRVTALYIADGHHRIASAARARDELDPTHGQEPDAERCFFLGVAFPDNETWILAYNRTVANLAGHSSASFLETIRSHFPVRPDANPSPPKGEVAMYLGGTWYAVDLSDARPSPAKSGPAEQLDVAVLQDRLLAPILRIEDVRTDPRMTFIGGAESPAALKATVDSGGAAVAFSMSPVTIEELLAVSDVGGIMPPKSTWFEPKLRDGLLIHLIRQPAVDSRQSTI